MATATLADTFQADSIEEFAESEARLLVEVLAEGKQVAKAGILQTITSAGWTAADLASKVETLKSRRQSAQALREVESLKATIDAKQAEHQRLDADLTALRKEFEAKLWAAQQAASVALNELSLLKSDANGKRREALAILQTTCDPEITSRIHECEAELQTVTRKLAEAELQVNRFRLEVDAKAKRAEAFARGAAMSTGAESPSEATVNHAERQRDSLRQLRDSLEAELSELRQKQLDPKNW